MTIVGLLVLTAGCGGDDGGSGPGADSQGGSREPEVEDPGAIHVHGLGVNPKDGALFVASHTGLFRAAKGETTTERVADRYQDTMGFTVIGPDRFLGSGHPDGREGLPPFLGLIRSTDAGETWQEVSLMGDADFHVLEASGSLVYGFGSDYSTREPRFLVSENDGEDWKRRPLPGGIISLVISPDDPRHVVAAIQGGSAGDGVYESVDAGRRWRRRGEDLGLLAWAGSGALVLVDARGDVNSSEDGGRSWREVGEIGGEPAAFEAAGDDLYAALHDGTIKQSRDGGGTWTVRSTPEAAVTQ